MFSRLSRLTVSLDGHYPYYYLHDNRLGGLKSAGQGWDFDGDTASFLLKGGNYTVYAINDFVIPDSPHYKETNEYILSDIVEVPVGATVEKNFALTDARRFTVKARSLNNEDLVLAQWIKAFTTYDMAEEKAISVSFSDPTIGDRHIYLSNKPENGLDTDIKLQILGYPDR